MLESPRPKQKGNARLAREGFALFVCEDGEWTLAKLYGKQRQDSATGDAKLSLVSSHVVAVRLIQQYIEPQTQQLRSKLLMDVVKQGEDPPPPPDIARPELGYAKAPGASAGRAPSSGAYSGPATGKIGASGELGHSMTLGKRLMIIGSLGGIAGIIGPIVIFSHLQEHGDGATSGIVLTGAGIFLACIAGVAFAAARAKAERPANEWWRGPTLPDPSTEPARDTGAEMVAARKASLLQFLYGCFTDPRYGQFLQLAKGNETRRHAVRLFIVGAAQSCISSLPKSFRPKLADMIDEALAMPGGDQREKQEFLDDLDRNCLAERNAPLLREGRDGMTAFLGNGRVDIQWLNSTIEAWIKPDPEPGTPEPEEEAPPAPQPVAIMFTDIILPAPVGGETSEEEKAKLVEQHDFTVGMAVKMHFGQQVQHMGTGMMAVFPRICDAIAASAVIQREVTDRNELGFGPSLPIRIGLAAGTSDPTDANQFTVVVETAAKLCAAASIGQVFMPAWLTDMQGCDRFTYSEQFAPPPKILPDQQRARMLLSTPEEPVSKTESEAGRGQERTMAEKSAASAPAAE